MSPEENKAIVRRFVDQIVNKLNRDAMDEFLDPNLIDHSPAPIPELPSGPVGIIDGLVKMRVAFPDIQQTIEDIVAQGDRVAIRTTWRGTHKGEFLGIAPTGTYVEVTGTHIARLVNGKIVEIWGDQNELGLMQQLGFALVPPQAF